MSIVTEHRIGRFSIPLDVLTDSPETVQTVLQTVVVVRAEARIDRRTIDYSAFSTVFEPVEPGEEPPLYDMNITDEGAVIWARME